VLCCVKLNRTYRLLVVCLSYSQYASLDGGLSFGLCTSAAGFPLRDDLGTAMDALGFLYVFGGSSQSGSTLTDMWKSSFSFNDVTQVAANCNVTLSPCGTGLRCWPTAPNQACPCNLATPMTTNANGFAVAVPTTNSMTFTQLPTASWSARPNAAVAWITKPINAMTVNGTQIIAPVGPSAIAYGGASTSQVWLSTDYLQSWNQMAITGSVASSSSACEMWDTRAYYSFDSSTVYSSTDGIHWNTYTGAYGGIAHGTALCLIDQYSTAYVLGGNTGNYQNDVVSYCYTHTSDQSALR
jgi:hypothetical protein